jgi:hypothetical protein
VAAELLASCTLTHAGTNLDCHCSKQASVAPGSPALLASSAHGGLRLRSQGFPTLYLYKGKTKEVVAYEGNRSLEDMVEFVALHSGEAAPAAAAAPGAPGIESAGADGDEEDAKDEL